MLPRNCGKLLYNAVRETLETMAFADVVPCSIKVAGEEFAQDADFAVMTDMPAVSGGENAQGWGDEALPVPDTGADTWGTASPEVASPEESWGDSPEPTGTSPETPSAAAAADDWGTVGDPPPADSAWGERSNVLEPAPDTNDPWGEADLADAVSSGQNPPKEADFDEMVTAQTDWCWACMNVNSPDVHSVWFVVPQSLARALMENMYAGEETQFDTPLVRDLIAELTNVLGGRLMLLLEEMGGKFTLTVPDIGFGFPDIPEMNAAQSVVCKIVVDSEHPIIVVLCFNHGGVLAAD